jgi:hypothetical protein
MSATTPATRWTTLVAMRPVAWMTRSAASILWTVVIIDVCHDAGDSMDDVGGDASGGMDDASGVLGVIICRSGPHGRHSVLLYH